MEIKNAIALAAAVLITFAAVAAMQTIWGDTIAQNRAAHQQQLLRETLFEVDYETIEIFAPKAQIKPTPKAQIKSTPKAQIESFASKAQPPTARVQQWWRAIKDGKTQAVVVRAATRGYGGDILFLMSFNRQGQLLRTRILHHRETPRHCRFSIRA